MQIGTTKFLATNPDGTVQFRAKLMEDNPTTYRVKRLDAAENYDIDKTPTTTPNGAQYRGGVANGFVWIIEQFPEPEANPGYDNEVKAIFQATGVSQVDGTMAAIQRVYRLFRKAQDCLEREELPTFFHDCLERVVLKLNPYLKKLGTPQAPTPQELFNVWAGSGEGVPYQTLVKVMFNNWLQKTQRVSVPVNINVAHIRQQPPNNACDSMLGHVFFEGSHALLDSLIAAQE